MRFLMARLFHYKIRVILQYIMLGGFGAMKR